MWWLALWFSSVPMTAQEAPYILERDSNAYVVAVDTREAAMLTFNSLDWDAAFNFTLDPPATYNKFYRMREQVLTFTPGGSVTLKLRASPPPRFPVIWNIQDPVVSPSTSAHYFVANSSTAVMNVVKDRWINNGEICKVFWGDEWKLEPQLWVRPK